MKKTLFFKVAIAASLASSAKNFDVRSFGAVGDGKSFDTQAVQASIDACSAGGGGRVTLADGVFLVKPLMLKSGVELYIDRSARLLGSGDWRDYPNRGTLRHVDSSKLPRARDAALITADESENIAITGGGTIDANGLSFVRPRPGSENDRWHYERIGGFDQSPPRVVFFTGCRDVTVRDVTMTNQPAGWSYWIHDCDRVVFDGCHVLADVHYPNNDGIHINASRDVSICNCIIETGDDSIIVRANTRSLRERKPCERVTVANCHLRSYANCIRLAWSMDGVVRDCTFSNLTMRDSNVGITINFIPSGWNPAGDYGVEATLVENIVFSGIVMDRIHTWPVNAAIEPEAERSEGMRNITFSNVVSSSGARPRFCGTMETPLKGFSFVNCRFRLNDGPETLVPWTKTGSFAERIARTNSFMNCRGFSFVGTTVCGTVFNDQSIGWDENGCIQR